MTIDQEFKSLIPPLTSDEYHQLEENILRDGIRDSVTYWDNNGEHILIDGHNRWEIAQKHNLPINQRRMTFPDRESVIQWIILNQFGRRNLSAYDRSVLALKLKPIIAERAKENQSEAGGAVHQKSDKAVNTNKELAQMAGVSHDTIHKVETIQNKAPEDIKEQVKSGDMSINKAYKQIIGEKPRQQDPVIPDLPDEVPDHEDHYSRIMQILDELNTFMKLDETGELKASLKGADEWDLRELLQKSQKGHSNLIHLMRTIEEVHKEKP